MENNHYISGMTIGFRPTFSTSKPSRKQAKNALKMRPAFTGKETDCKTGFSYFGARYYDPTLLTSWTAVDPMADKYPDISPYAYCAWNPVKIVDPDGREYSPIYDPNGVFLGCTSEGFSGNVYICLGTPPSCLKEDWSAMNEDDLLDDPDGSYVFVTFNSAGLSNDAKEKIWTDIVKTQSGAELEHGDDSRVFDMNSIGNKIIFKDGNYNWQSLYVPGTSKGIIYGSSRYTNAYETTVENILASVISHEWLGHIIQNYSDHNNNHYKAYLNVINGPFGGKTTKNYKMFVLSKLKEYMDKVNMPYPNKYQKDLDTLTN